MNNKYYTLFRTLRLFLHASSHKKSEQHNNNNIMSNENMTSNNASI